MNFRSLGLLRNRRRPISVPGTPGLCARSPTRELPYTVTRFLLATPMVRSLKKRRPAKIILDLDSTDDHTHGQQEFSFYHWVLPKPHFLVLLQRLPTGSTSDRPKGAANWTVTTRPICPPKSIWLLPPEQTLPKIASLNLSPQEHSSVGHCFDYGFTECMRNGSSTRLLPPFVGAGALWCAIIPPFVVFLL